MELEERVRFALDRGWAIHQGVLADELSLPATIRSAVDVILEQNSTPNRQFLLTIAAGTAQDPTSNPASLQLPAGVDRRGQERVPRKVLTEFRNEKGLTLKISQDAGVSNQWRENQIDQSWVAGRRPNDRVWAEAFLSIVEWLSQEVEFRGELAQSLLEYVAAQIVSRAVRNQLDYPRFRVTPSRAMELVRGFLDDAPDRPDALEAVVTVAARSLAGLLATPITVRRRDINSPDPIDVLLVGEDDLPISGIEVTDDFIGVGKLEHEVVPAMLALGLSHVLVVSRGVSFDETDEVSEYLVRALNRFGQRIDLVTVDAIELWLNFPGTDLDVATRFLWSVGDELDELSRDGNRRAWYDVLSRFVVE